MEPEPSAAEAMRRRLYRPGASPSDLTSYLQVVGDGSAAGEPPGHAAADAAAADAAAAERERGPRGRSGGSRRWLLLLGAVAGVVVVALIGGELATGAFAPSPVAASRAPATSGSATATKGGSGDALSETFRDGGRRAAASGDAVVAGPMGGRADDSRAPAGEVRYRYTVTAGDTVSGITTRFGLCAADVVAAAPYGFDWARPAPGTVLLLERTATFAARDASGTC